jgi:hypothetical protein
MTTTAHPLSDSVTVVLDAAGAGQATIGPTRDPSWSVDTVILTTDRPGAAPVPRAAVYLDQVSPSRLQGITYDGSWDSAASSLRITRGQALIATWSGGAPGDQATITVTGTRGT